MAALVTKRDDEDTDEENEFQEIFDKIPEPDLIIEQGVVYLKRPWIQNFLAMSSQEKKVKKVITEEERAERQERLKQMEIERKKALKQAQKRNELKRLALGNQDRVGFDVVLDTFFNLTNFFENY